jgi:O-antigen/teichoic acid export membrane protein
LAAAAEPIIITLVGEKWRPSIPYLQIMSLYGAIYPLQILNINILNVLKKSNYILKLEIIKKFLFIPVIIVGLYTSLKTMLWAAVIYYYFEFFLNGWYSKRLIGYSTFQQINDLKTVYFVSLSVSIIIWMFTILHIPYLAMLIIQIAAAILLYLFVYTILNHQEFSELKDICLKHLLAIVKRS